VAGACGVLLFVKPLVEPVMHDTGPFSFTSETHLYYVVPGLLLALLALFLGLVAGRGSDRMRTLLVAITSATAAFVMLGTFFVGRPSEMEIVTLLVPGLAAAVLAIVLIARFPQQLETALGKLSMAAEPTHFASSPYATDPHLRSLVRAVAHAPAMSAPRDLVGRSFGAFEILELLGEGGMGRVYRTRDHRLMREVALKILPPELAHDVHRRERLLREARAAARINHPNVAALYDIGYDEGVPFLVLELCRGPTLRSLIGTLDPARAWAISLQIAHGLAAAHAHGIVHRDLKPENVMLNADGPVKILDFGVARASDASLGGNLTEEAAVIGTPAYMSPEQAMALPVDVRSDVFTFGTLLAEMLTGHCPFVRPTAHATRIAVIDVAFPPGYLEAMAEPLRSIALRCMQREPDKRYASAAELVHALNALMGVR